MNKLNNYLLLAKTMPDLFKNTGEAGEIKIILHKKRILDEHKKIRAKLKKEGNPLYWIDIGILAEDQWFYILRDMGEGLSNYKWVTKSKLDQIVKKGQLSDWFSLWAYVMFVSNLPKGVKHVLCRSS